MARVAEKNPGPVGLKETSTTWLPPAAMVKVVRLGTKTGLSDVMLVMVIGTALGLVTVSGSDEFEPKGVLPKLRLWEAGAMPTVASPVIGTMVGLPAALWLIERLEDLEPGIVGV